MPTKQDEYFEIIIESLQLMAADYDTQIDILPTFIHVPDEIALIFDEAHLCALELKGEGLINEQQELGLARIDQRLDDMSNNEGLWTLDQLKSSPQWSELRGLALEVMASFGLTKKRPNIHWLQFVPSRIDD